MMLVAVTTRVVPTEAYEEWRDALSQEWASVLQAHGLLPLPVANGLSDPAALLDELPIAALLLSGGDDLGPSLWPGAEPVPDALAARDRTERALLERAVQRGMPVLGVCRGMQLLNVWFGGSIRQALAPHVHVAAQHSVAFETAAGPVAAGEALVVNSFHRNVITDDDLAPAFVPVARADDGTVEAVRHRGMPIMGVQWHPERSGSPRKFDKWLFEEWIVGCV